MQAHVAIAVGILRQFGNISLKALREHLQRRLGVNLETHKPLIRSLGELSLEVAEPNTSFVAWEPLYPTLALADVGRGRELFQQLSDVEDEFPSGRWPGGPYTACWQLFCLEHGFQLDGQLSVHRTIAGGDDAYSIAFSGTGAGNYAPHGVMVGLSPAAVDDVSARPFQSCGVTLPMYIDLNRPIPVNTCCLLASLRSDVAKAVNTAVNSIRNTHAAQYVDWYPSLLTFAKTLTGKIITLGIEVSMFVNMRAKIQDTSSLPHDQQYLTFAGMQLVDGGALCGYNIQKGLTLETGLFDPGGCAHVDSSLRTGSSHWPE